MMSAPTTPIHSPTPTWSQHCKPRRPQPPRWPAQSATCSAREPRRPPGRDQGQARKARSDCRPARDDAARDGLVVAELRRPITALGDKVVTRTRLQHAASRSSTRPTSAFERPPSTGFERPPDEHHTSNLTPHGSPRRDSVAALGERVRAGCRMRARRGAWRRAVRTGAGTRNDPVHAPSTNRSSARRSWLAVPLRPLTCQVSTISTSPAGTTAKRTSRGPDRASLSGCTTKAAKFRYWAWTKPLAKGHCPVKRYPPGTGTAWPRGMRLPAWITSGPST